MNHHDTLQLFDYQEAILGKLRDGFIAGHRAQMLVAPTGAGKCLGIDTPVLMYDGTVKAVQNVVRGDLLMGPDSKPRRVLSTTHGIGPLYRVTPTKGDSYVVNDAHILSLKMTSGATKWDCSRSDTYKAGKVHNITVTDYLSRSATFRHCAKGWRCGVEFAPTRQPLPLPSYFLGLWIGDGLSRAASVCSADAEIIAEVDAVAAAHGLVTRVEHQLGNRSVVVHINSGQRGGHPSSRPLNAVMRKLRRLSLIENKHIPHCYLVASRAERLQLLAGLLDTDGALSRGGYDFVQKSERIARQVAFLARSLGLAAYVSKSWKTCGNNGVQGMYWRVSISGDCSVIPVRLARRKAPVRAINKDPLMVGLKVEPIGDGDYFGFQIDGDRLFLLGDFTVTHNTEMAMELLEAAANKGNRAAMVLDRVVLCNQTSERLDKYGMDHGVLQAGHWRFRPDRLIQVCSAQTLEKRGSFPNLKLLIVDEAHQTRKQTIEFIRSNPWVKVVGLSATPFTQGLGKTYTNVVSAISTRELVERGRLAPLRVFIAKEIDMDGAKKVAGEWSSKEAESRGMAITGDVVTEWVKKTHEFFGGPRKTVVFAAGVAHAADLAQKFNEAGYNFVSLSYKDDDEFKAEAIKEFAKPDTTIHGLIATDILTKGFDVPDVMIGVSARPFSKSFASHVQQMGRVMRSYPGKDFALWLDHSGNYLRFMEDWEDVYANGVSEIEEGKEKARKEPTKEQKEAAKCPACSALFPRHMDTCPCCGHVRPRRNDVIAVPGELQELMAHGKAEKDRDARQQFYSQLCHIVQERGYNPGWAAHKYKARFGVWPRGLSHTPTPPEAALWRWLAKQQQIERKYREQREEAVAA